MHFLKAILYRLGLSSPTQHWLNQVMRGLNQVTVNVLTDKEPVSSHTAAREYDKLSVWAHKY